MATSFQTGGRHFLGALPQVVLLYVPQEECHCEVGWYKREKRGEMRRMTGLTGKGDDDDRQKRRSNRGGH